MKKHDEGYVLPLVLVVMIVMCLIATSLMSFSLQNLKSQQASIDRMVEKYKAEGVVEIIESKLKNMEFQSVEEIANFFETVVIQNSDYEIKNCQFAKEQCIAEFDVVPETDVGTVQIHCEMVLIFEDKNVSVSYSAYEISNIGGNAS